jgi:predicted outer membrane repeat protein
MSRFEPIVRSWSAISRSLPQFAPARRPHARRRPMLQCLESRSLLSTIPLTVNSLADAPSSSGVTTLRGAITTADANPADSYVINFAVKGVIDLKTALPDLTNNISIQGPGVTIQRDPSAVPFTVLTINWGDTARISDVTISGGNSSLAGGILNEGVLTIQDSRILNNNGMGINNQQSSTLFLIDSVIIGNDGCGLLNGATATVIDSLFIGNDVGGINSSVGTLTVADCDFINNTSNYGGGISTSGPATVQDSLFVNNSAIDGGGIYAAVAITVTNNAFVDNSASSQGGAMFIQNTSSNPTAITNNIIYGNSAPSYGGIYIDTVNATGPIEINGNIFIDNTGGDVN